MCLLTGHFVKFKIRHIFIMQFGGYFVKFYSRQIFQPYGTCTNETHSLAPLQDLIPTLAANIQTHANITFGNMVWMLSW